MNLKAGFPYWLIKDGLLYNYPKLQASFEADVVIMGGGISGALMAYYLCNAGINSVVVDARAVGLGSTCASTSLLQYEIDIPLCELQKKIGNKNAVAAYNLCRQAIDDLVEIAGKINFKEIEYKKSLFYAAEKKHVKLIEEEYNVRKQNNFEVELLDKKAIQQQFNLSSGAAILSACAGQTNAYGFTHALHQHNIKNGCQVFNRTNITKIDHQKTGVKLTTETGFTINTKKLIYANGYESVNYINKKIVSLQSTYATISEQISDDENFLNSEVLMWNTNNPYLYMRTTPDRRIIVGGRDEDFYDPERRDKLIDKKVSQLKKDFKTLYPKIDFKPEFNWTGTFGSTKDGLPFIGPYKNLPNSYFALGFGGNGITFSVIAAQIVTDLLKGKQNEDQKLFAFERV